MGLNRYEIFLKVAEVGNITRAAELLHYTQAGVSHTIAALEREAGVPLLIRGSNGVTLTENGKRLIQPIQTLVNDQRALEQSIFEINEVVAGTLRLGAFTSVAAQWLPFLIRDFQKRYPNVEFELLAGDYDEITEHIFSGKIDCGFLSAPTAEGLSFAPLYEDPMLVLLPEGHELEREQVLTLAQIKKEPFILPMKGSDNDIQAVLRGSSKKVQVRYTLNDDFSVMSMVSHGFGITVMPELILKNFNLALSVRPMDPPQYRTIGIASPPMDRLSIVTKTFIHYLSGIAPKEYREMC